MKKRMEANDGEGYKRESEILYAGGFIPDLGLKPETVPCFLTTAFVMDDLSEALEVKKKRGYTYIRTANPNRTALAQAVSYLEGGESSLIFSSGMGAITTALITLLAPGDHVICNEDIYGETFEVMTKVMSKMSVDVEFMDLANPAAVKKAIRPATKMIYTEVISNPTLTLADLRSLAAIIHETKGVLMVDNTFTTPLAIRPLDFGADLVMNSLTKFLNGHSDAMGGSITARAEIIDKIQPFSMLCGTPGDPFSSWLIYRGLHTVELRVPKQMTTAAKLAEALRADKRVIAVNHPSLPDYPQRQLAAEMFVDQGRSAMLSFTVAEDIERIDRFMANLHFAHYAPTLGGIRTSLSHPVTSSHYNVPDAIRRQRGITPGMIRVSVGIENADDLINDFRRALEIFN
ncbi:MAG: aminotransferase class I/II-fold pyridoxal phosphate-dependent enzyme [Peptococcaceae bacterium]|jgi:cystathionine gamma-synthase|nr:aminotransferase class I/II-fold pyridoxal phosphate-dependent enzyme [Peptococcaceae bacterium]